MARTDRGFASLDLDKRREISSLGGQAAHRLGKAHKWTTEEAREAGRKGGMASHRRRPEQAEEPPKLRTTVEQLASDSYRAVP